MNSKTIFVILISVFYTAGLCASITNHAIFFCIICFCALIALIFTNLLSAKQCIALFILFIFGFFNTSYQIKEFDSLKGIFANNVVLSGRAVSISQISKNGERAKFYLDVKNAQLGAKNYPLKNTKALVSINDEKKAFNKIRIGDTITVKGKLRTPKPATNPSQFDYAKYLKYKDVFSILYSNGENFKILKKADSFSNPKEFWWYILQKLDESRDNILAVHSKYIKSPQLEILGGIVFGNEAINPPDDIKQNFINSGLLHLLAASGLNVALIFGMWWFLAERVFRLPFVFSITGGMFFVILYTFMTGFPPSILRASIMILFVLAGKLIDREANPLSLIFLVGFLMLVANPKMFCDVGFQLSFIVTIGLIYCVEPAVSKFRKIDGSFKEKFKEKPKAIKILASPAAPCAIAGAVLVPLVAQLFVAPLQMYYFNTFTPMSLFANLCVIPFVGIISFLGFISSILSLIPYLGDKITILFDILVNPFLVILVKISEFFAQLKYSILTMPSPDIFQMFLYWGLIFIFIENLKRNFTSKKLLICLITGILILFATIIKLPSHGLEIISFDVANADSFLIKTPKNKYIMIDTGRLVFKNMSNARMIMCEYFKDNNIKELELLIITHFDTDHAGGAPDILNDFKVKRTIIQSTHPDNIVGKQIIKILNDGRDFEVAKNNTTIYKESALEIKTFVANLDENDIEKDKPDNENSIVTLIKSPDVNALFMADSGIRGYQKIAPYLEGESVEILKVGHHGAKFVVDDKMLNSLKPNYAIISTGYNNYGHPNYKTLDTLNSHNIKLLTTKDLGAIKISNCKNHANCRVEHFDNGFKKFTSKIIPTEDNFLQSDFAKNLIKESLPQN